MSRMPSGFSAPGSPSPRNDQSVILNIVATAEALDWSPGFTFQSVAGAMPAAPLSDIQAGIELAESQLAAARAFGSPDVYHRPKLSDIPVCPGCPAGQIETRLRVTVSDLTGKTITEGNVGCIGGRIPTETDLSSCANGWGDQLVESHYSDVSGYQVTYEVVSAQRGTFFGQ